MFLLQEKKFCGKKKNVLSLSRTFFSGIRNHFYGRKRPKTSMEIDQKPLVLFQEIFLNVIIDISLAQVNAAPK